MAPKSLMMERIVEDMAEASDANIMALCCAFPKCPAHPVKMLSTARPDGSRNNYMLCREHAELVTNNMSERQGEQRQGIFFYGVVRVS